MPYIAHQDIVTSRMLRFALCTWIASLLGATTGTAQDARSEDRTASPLVISDPLRSSSGFDSDLRAAGAQNPADSGFSASMPRAGHPLSSPGEIRFAGYAAWDDGAGGQNYVLFPRPVAVGPLSSRIIAGTFFSDDYAREYVLILAQALELSSFQTADRAIHQTEELTIQFGTQASIAADPSSGVLYGIESDAPCSQTILITIDKSTGAAAFVTHLAPCSQSLAIDSNSIIYSIDRDTDAVQVLNDGTLTELGAVGVAINDTSSLAVVPGTDELLLFQFDAGNMMYTVDKTSGLATLVGPVGGTLPLSAIALAPDDVFADGFDE